jgi:hypothetical protein
MEPAKGQFDNVVSLDAKRAEKKAQLKGERQWGPQQAGIVKPYDPDNK